MRLESKLTTNAYLTFQSNSELNDFPLDSVTNKLQIEPNCAYKKGDVLKEPHLRPFTAWEYHTETQSNWDVNDVLQPLVTTFQNKVTAINELKAEYDLSVRIYLVVSIINGETPGLCIYSDVAHFISAINADLDIDMWIDPFVLQEE
ncbi:hypothetical protein A6M13_15845 [Caryophanon tenue]|uniref:DUF4279 domain-containing protein n=1 Tax=Caryophanon tenue TaxID=33978 RepID=A0A1C0Y8H4_9BACL|nr:hypothetical protein A6M13_15845 [Caryophanon tenue]